MQTGWLKIGTLNLGGTFFFKILTDGAQSKPNSHFSPNRTHSKRYINLNALAKLEVIVFKPFQFGRVKFVVWERVKTWGPARVAQCRACRTDS